MRGLPQVFKCLFRYGVPRSVLGDIHRDTKCFTSHNRDPRGGLRATVDVVSTQVLSRVDQRSLRRPKVDTLGSGKKRNDQKWCKLHRTTTKQFMSTIGA